MRFLTLWTKSQKFLVTPAIIQSSVPQNLSVRILVRIGFPILGYFLLLLCPCFVC